MPRWSGCSPPWPRGRAWWSTAKFSRRGFWELIGTRQITWINAVPAIITILAMDPPVATQGRVRFIRSASAPLAPSALRRFEETFGIPVVETYGMTEAASMITANPLDGPRKARGWPGRYRGPGGQPGRGSASVVPARHDRPGADQGPGRHHGVRGGRPGRRHRRGRLARDRRPRPPGPGRLPVPGRPLRRRDQPGRGRKSTRGRSRSSCSPSPGSGPPRWSRPATRCSGSARSPT